MARFSVQHTMKKYSDRDIKGLVFHLRFGQDGWRKSVFCLLIMSKSDKHSCHVFVFISTHVHMTLTQCQQGC